MNGIKKAKKFMWNKEIEQDFINLKRAFTEGEIQAFPDFGAGDPFILTIDWRKENIQECCCRSRTGRRDPQVLGNKV